MKELPAPVKENWADTNPLSLGVEGICKLTTPELLDFLEYYLSASGYQPIIGKGSTADSGYIYAPGEIPVLLVAHVDTVHKQKPTVINHKKGKLSSPQGIGGDDRCGVYAITQIIKTHKCHVLFADGEENGCHGTEAFLQTDHKNMNVNYMIEIDRRGSNDAVFYSCDNPEFTNFVLDATGFKKQYGSFTDISRLMPSMGIAGVNLSSGYYNAHTKDEYIVLDELDSTIVAAKALIDSECTKPFKYIKGNNTWGSYWNDYKSYGAYGYGSNRSTTTAKQRSIFEEEEDPIYYDKYYRQPQKSSSKYAKQIYPELDYNLTLTVSLVDCGYGMDDGFDDITVTATGKTKEECWANLFLENQTLCFEDILDYEFR